MTTPISNDSLRAHLNYEPRELKFGTSGRRGDVVDLTQLEVYINASAEVRYLLSLPAADGGIAVGQLFFFACDLRASSTEYVAHEQGRGEIAQAIERAIRDAGLIPVYLGLIPTPALTYFALKNGCGSIMVTGSHIPFNRNGYKTNSAKGELRKDDEAPIGQMVAAIREQIYGEPFSEGLFDESGRFKTGHTALPEAIPDAHNAYIARYQEFFSGRSLTGRRILVYQHSAVGRDLLVEMLERLDAQVIPAGRSESFVPIDTENIDDAQVQAIQALADAATKQYGPLDAVVSTDGDSDRPLVLGIEPSGKVHFYGGDLIGMIVADYLQADAVVVPISCNDAIDRGPLRDKVQPKTKIGSPYVIAGMKKAQALGKSAVCGWEANGGFLAGTDFTHDGRTLTALPTRDAMLPILTVLFAMSDRGLPLVDLFASLPHRFSRAALLTNFRRETSLRIVAYLSPSADHTKEQIRSEVSKFFTAGQGFGAVTQLDYTDGVRIYFDGGDVAHIRPSGNADELRIYAVADTQERANVIAEYGVAEPDGILRRLEKQVNAGSGSKPTATAAPKTIPPAIAAYREHPYALPLKGAVQHYEWGGYDFIPLLIGIDNPERRPFAELWIGAHPSAPAATSVDGFPTTLDHLIADAPEALLGEAVSAKFGRLPYLFKVLDARQMLSIQAHPSKAQAEEGFARENATGVSIKAANRNYKDDNHKPEVHVVLTDFWMLHGFRPLEEIGSVLQSTPELIALLPDFAERLYTAGTDEAARKALLRALYEKAMTMPQSEVDATLEPLIARLASQSALDKDHPDFWALRAANEFPLPGGHRDRGIFSIYLLNLLHLKPGQGTYQPAGTLHAYLEGVNMELMANSDNVLRGGLTPKHVDVAELISVLTFESGLPPILDGHSTVPTEQIYTTPATEFVLSRIDVSANWSHTGKSSAGPHTLIVLDGRATVHAGEHTFPLVRGEILLVPPGIEYTVDAPEASAVLFKAAIP